MLGNKKTFCYISAGGDFSMALDHNSKLWAWGNNTHGQVGIPIGNQTTPATIGTHLIFNKMSAGYDQSLGLDNTGQVWGWGLNGYGQLGDNSTINRCTPVSILGNKKTFCQIFAGNSSFGIDYNGLVWSWGQNRKGELGDNSLTEKCIPVSILGAKKTFCKISNGVYHTMAIQHNGQLWGWGYNFYGQLGDDTTVDKLTPVSVHGTKKTFCQITTGGNAQLYTLGIQHNGQVWGWGDNTFGQLGDNTQDAQTRSPASIKGNKKTFCSIDASAGFNVSSIDYTGQVWTWGLNSSGQLGDNSISDRCTPVSILGAKKTFCKISSGFSHTFGIQHNGQAWGWGFNGYGQLGDNTIISKRTPVSIHGNKKTFCDIKSFLDHTLALDQNGFIWGWGLNNVGQIGNFNTKTPIRVYNL